MKKTLYLMRHGETLFNVRKKIQGWCDSPLTEKGIRQCEKARETFESIEIDHYYSSTSERACDTIELVTNNKPYTRLKGLKELNFGIYEGESEDLQPKDFKVFENFFADYGGESVHDVANRINQTLIEIMDKEDHNNVLVVSHAGAMFNFFALWGDFAEVMKYGKFSNCSVMKFEYEDKSFRLVDVINHYVD